MSEFGVVAGAKYQLGDPEPSFSTFPKDGFR